MNFDFIKHVNVQRDILILVVFILLVVLVRCNSEKNNDIDILKNNLNALNDTIRVVTTKNGQLEYEKGILITTSGDLRKLNTDLYRELDKERGKVEVIIKERVVYIRDTIYIDTTTAERLNDTTYKLGWQYYNKKGSIERDLKGSNYFVIDSLRNIKSQRTVLEKDMISLDIVTGIKKEDGVYRAFARLADSSGQDFVKFNHLEGAKIDDELFSKKRWDVGISFGLGILNGPINQVKLNETFVWQIGIGVNYTLFEF